MIMIMVTIMIRIPSFVVLLNSLYFKLWVLIFVHSPPHLTGGSREEWVSSFVTLVARE